MDIVIATNNLGKVKEFQSLLAPYGYTVKSLKERNIYMISIRHKAFLG